MGRFDRERAAPREPSTRDPAAEESVEDEFDTQHCRLGQFDAWAGPDLASGAGPFGARTARKALHILVRGLRWTPIGTARCWVLRDEEFVRPTWSPMMCSTWVVCD